jgi:hypothetical protein
MYTLGGDPELPTQTRLRAVYNYDPETGAFTRKIKMGKYPKGGLVGKLNGRGFRVVKINNRVYTQSRLIWLWVTGQLPAKYVMFRDGDRTNFRANNLYLKRDYDK